MEILWPALGICSIVFVVFFALAQHWQRLLRRQAWTIQRLTERVRELEEVDDPDFRRRLGESAPVPLEQVYNFSFRLTERFWQHTLAIGEEDLRYVQTHGSFVGTVKLERWRSHTVAIVTEVLPESKTTQWQTRSLDFYPDPASTGESLTLWQLSLARPDGTARRPPSLELALRGNFMELSRHLVPSGGDRTNGNGNGNARSISGNGTGDGNHAAGEESLLLRVPLDTAKLAEFRSHDPASSVENGNEHSGEAAGNSNGGSASNWQVFYSNHDEQLGVDWQLWLRDLSKKAEWERWKILETTAIQVGRDEV
jgi:hypothetical protein